MRRRFLTLLGLMLMLIVVEAQDMLQSRYDFLYAGEGKRIRMYIVKDGQVAWQFENKDWQGGEISDAVLLTDGHILMAYRNGIAEVSQDKKIVWHYQAPEGTEIHTIQPIGKNQVVFVQNGKPAKCVVMAIPSLKTVNEFELPTSEKGSVHGQFRNARLTRQGTLLVANMGLGFVGEYTSNGKEINRWSVPSVWSVEELENGHLLTTSSNGLVREFIRSGQTVWEVDAKNYGVKSAQKSVRLKNGNTIINNWHNEWRESVDTLHGPVQAVEIDHNGKVLCQLCAWKDPDLGPSTTIQPLDQAVNREQLFFSDVNGQQQNDREYWCSLAYKMAQPVLENMAKGELQRNMKTEFSPSFDNRDRSVVYMETFGRLMAGIAPWLTLPDDDTAEGQQRRQLREWALAAYKNAVDPDSPDYLCWGKSGQNLVDAAYIAESFLRAWDALWKPLDDVTKQRYIHEFQGLRRIDPPYTNWLLFSSTIESFLAKAGAQFDEFRVNTACRKVEEWYVGDGWYADGPVFAFDYYSSYVFHAMYLETLQAMVDSKHNSRLDYQKYYDRALKRAQKYAIILERFISPEGTFPVIGRSTPYRMAAMQPLALMAWYEKLPSDLSNGQVRAALTKVMHRMFDQQENFNDAGYLTIGFCGSQPETADWYTNNGSLYMTSLAFMPLGLPAAHPFWTDAPQPWTQVKAWGGQPFPKDHRWDDTIQTKDKW